MTTDATTRHLHNLGSDRRPERSWWRWGKIGRARRHGNRRQLVNDRLRLRRRLWLRCVQGSLRLGFGAIRIGHVRPHAVVGQYPLDLAADLIRIGPRGETHPNPRRSGVITVQLGGGNPRDRQQIFTKAHRSTAFRKVRRHSR